MTTERIESLPSELKNLRSLSDVRAYVADTVFEGGEYSTLRPRRGGKKIPPFFDPLSPSFDPKEDPLGLRQARGPHPHPHSSPRIASPSPSPPPPPSPCRYALLALYLLVPFGGFLGLLGVWMTLRD